MKLTLFLCALGACSLLSCNKDWLDYSPMDMYSNSLQYDDENAPKHLNVAAVSIQSDKTNKDVTLETIKTMVEKVKSEHDEIQVIEFGELILEWYYDNQNPKEYQRSMSEPIPGNATNFVKNLAITHQVNIVFGMTELDSVTQKLYNTQVLIKPNGELVKYRKRNLNPTDIENGMSAGDSLVLTEIDGIKVAMFICSDMQSSKISKEITDAKVDVILQSVTSTTDMNANISYVGMQLNTWIVFANRYGKEDVFDYTGFNHIINPAGTISERAIGNNVYVFRRLGIFNP